ncbi:hypothetical protein ACXYTP_19200 [Tsukamurella ocularis]|uniref:hypothetical protein n=1 Tax=Tsukamurella ocularis TaxID=1970234 RepID=UPI0039EFF099
MSRDLAAINVPASRRGVDAEIDRHLAADRRAARTEGVVVVDGVPHLARGGRLQVWANRTQAERAADRVGGVAYQDPRSRTFHVRLDEEVDR